MKTSTFFLNRTTILLFAFLTSTSSFSQPANNDCSGAIMLSVSATCTNSLVNFDGTETDSGVAITNCGDYEADLWYQFMMPSSGSARVTTSVSDGSVADGAMALYKDTCGSLFYIGCDSDSNGAFEEMSLVETPGTIIYVRLWQDIRFNPATIGTHNICVVELTAPPIATNDDCSTAEILTTDVSCVTVLGSNFQATDSAIADPTIPDPGCAATYSGGDVWYSVLVPASGDLAVETSNNDGTIQDGGLALYSGTCAPNGLTLLDCDDDSGSPGFERIELFGRTPGETIYARVWAFNNESVGTFNICALELNPLTVSEEIIADFKLFPNPTSDLLNIAFKNTTDAFTTEIYDVQGKLVVTTENKSQINISDINSGLYFVKIQTKHGQNIQKLIIE